MIHLKRFGMGLAVVSAAILIGMFLGWAAQLLFLVDLNVLFVLGVIAVIYVMGKLWLED